MADSGKTRTVTEPQPAVEFYREPLGRSWLIGLLVIPLLIAGIGYIMAQRTQSANAPALAPTSSMSTTSFAPRFALAALSITYNGNDIVIVGDFPDDSAKFALLRSLSGAVKENGRVIDKTHINPEAKALDFTNAEPVFTASAPIPDFSFTVNNDTVILAGTAATPDQKTGVEKAATEAWRGVNVVNNIQVKGGPASPPATASPAPPPATPSPAPPPATPSPAPPPAPSAPPPGPGACKDLQAAINAATGGPIYFGNDGVTLTPAAAQALSQVSDKLKACPDARVTVNGYTDNSGPDSVNVPLSTQRATIVAEFLVAHGVARDHVVAKGLGPANPIAPNDTNEGRAKNRRAEIVVG
jgi:peptidoglycan-binding protein ArfA